MTNFDRNHHRTARALRVQRDGMGIAMAVRSGFGGSPAKAVGNATT
jgi:hypothetical protein